MKKRCLLHGKGFTLIELVVAMAIMGIVVTAAFPLFSFGNKIFKVGNQQYDMQSDIRRISSVIANDIRYASDIKILSSLPGNYNDVSYTFYGYDYIYLDSTGTSSIKKITFNKSTNTYSTSTLGEDSTIPTTFTLIFKDGGNNLLQYDLKASGDSREYTISSQVAIMNASIGKVDLSGTGSVVCYKIPDIFAAANTPPTAAPVTVSGLPQEGNVLTGGYTYYDLEGDVESGTTYQWYRKDPSSTLWNQIPGETSISHTLTADDVNKVICFEVTPRAATGASPGLPTKSNPTETIFAASVNLIPVINSITITGNVQKNSTLTVFYSYNGFYDEGSSILGWYESDSKTGPWNLVASGTRTYNLKPQDVGEYLYFSVQPIDSKGHKGTTYPSKVIGPVVNKIS